MKPEISLIENGPVQNARRDSPLGAHGLNDDFEDVFMMWHLHGYVVIVAGSQTPHSVYSIDTKKIVWIWIFDRRLFWRAKAFLSMDLDGHINSI